MWEIPTDDDQKGEKTVEHLILASGSPRRRELFELAGLSFEVVPSQVEEVITKESPEEIVKELATQKAKDVWEQTGKKHSVVGADTIVAYGNEILGKPKDEQDAFRMLSMLSGKIHQVYTGVCVIRDGKEHTFFEKTDVAFYPMTKEEIRHYIDTKEPMDKAGSYGIQGKAAVFIKGICGDYYNVVGFPIARFLQEMKRED